MNETPRKPRIARKYCLAIAILIISLVVGAAPAVAAVSGSSHSHLQLHVRPHLDFGALSSGSTTMTFTSALVVGRGTTSPLTFAFVKPATTWDRVFSGISIVVQTQGDENSRGNNDHRSGTDNNIGLNIDDEASAPKACISLGTGTCPTGLTATFTPTASTTYDYVAGFTAASTPPTGVSLQTTWSPTVAPLCPTAVSLGTASTYGVLASSTITNTGTTTITGDLGLSPGTSVTGSPIVTGTSNIGNTAAATAIADLTTALTNAQALTGATAVSGDLGGMTLTCGVYKSTSSLAITGTLTLDAQGNANAVFVFLMGSTLTTAAGANIILANGAQAANVFWVVGSSATLGATNTFKGTIMALASITVGSTTTINGRALAQTAAVTLDTDTITVP